MPRVKPAVLGRVFLYGSLACALGIALLPPGAFSRPAEAAPPDEKLLSLGRVIVEKYLSSLPQGAPREAVEELASLKPDTLLRVLNWLPEPTGQRPLSLIDSGLESSGPLFAALLETSLTGYQPAAAAELPTLLQQLPLPRDARLRLRLLKACAMRARTEAQPNLEMELLGHAARHPAAGWAEVETLVASALAERRTGPAVEMLQDWLDDPPEDHGEGTSAQARMALARLLLVDNQPAAAWEILGPLFQPETPPPSPALLDLAWSAATAAGQTTRLIEPLEAALRAYPQQQLNWRELAEAAPPEEEYLTGLRRLADACLAAGRESRAVDACLHLAWLRDGRVLVPVLPAVLRLGRMAEVLDLLERLDAAQPEEDGPRARVLASLSLENGEAESARALLEALRRTRPHDAAVHRLLLQTQANDQPPLQAAMLWKRHLRQHPGDTVAYHLLCDLWQQSGQPRAATNELLAAAPQHLDPALRQRAAALALETRHHAGFITAIERLLATEDALPEETAGRWAAHLEMLDKKALAQAVRAAQAR